MTQAIPSAIKWPGGKFYLAKKLAAIAPPCKTRVETHAGSLAFTLACDPGGISEVVNDVDGRLTNFWRVLQNDIQFQKFRRTVEAIPFSEHEFHVFQRDLFRFANEVTWHEDKLVDSAVAFFVVCRQSVMGTMKGFATLTRARTRRGMNEQASAWLTAVEGLQAVHNRLKRIAILNRDAVDVIEQQDTSDTLFYCDPPYPHETRAVKKLYEHEMSYKDHVKLLDTLKNCKGKFMLSGYKNGLYDEQLQGLNRVDFKLPNNMSHGSNKRRMTECVWCNF